MSLPMWPSALMTTKPTAKRTSDQPDRRSFVAEQRTPVAEKTAAPSPSWVPVCQSNWVPAQSHPGRDLQASLSGINRRSPSPDAVGAADG
jgi:hypothetical protein